MIYGILGKAVKRVEGCMFTNSVLVTLRGGHATAVLQWLWLLSGAPRQSCQSEEDDTMVSAVTLVPPAQ